MNPTEQPAVQSASPSVSAQISTVTSVNKPTVPAPKSSTLKTESLELHQQLAQAAIKDSTVDEFLRTVSNIINENSESLALWISKRSEAGEFSQIHAISDENANAVWSMVESQCRTLINITGKSKSIRHCPIKNYEHHQLIAVPVLNQNGNENVAEYVLAGCFSNKNQTQIRQLWLMSMVGQAFTSWFQQRKLEQASIKTKSLNDALSLIQTLDQTTDVNQACIVIVNHLRRLCDSEQVAISFCNQGTTGELMAISDVERVEVGSENNKLINHACQQAITTGKLLTYPQMGDENDASLLPLEQYCKSNRLPGCINVPLVTEEGTVLGALLVANSEERCGQPGFADYLGKMAKMISGHLDIVLRANRGLRDLAKSRVKRLRTASLTKPVLIGLVIACFAMAIPLPYRVACDCEMQPVMRRFIAAPYEGVLEKTLVEHGDVVEKDQVLARLDGRHVRIELAGLKAEYEGARKRRDSALAKGDFATSQIARSEMNRMQSKIDLLEQQVTDLEIRSPIEGIIVSGDLEKAEGAPLEMGQTLFEVGPLERMLAEVAIPESEIQYVEDGMKVAIKLNAFPFKNWDGVIKNIHPRSEIVNDESVFIAQVELPNDAQLLRPGLKGTAKVRSKIYPVGWNLFHEAWESVRYWMIW